MDGFILSWGERENYFFCDFIRILHFRHNLWKKAQHKIRPRSLRMASVGGTKVIQRVFIVSPHFQSKRKQKDLLTNQNNYFPKFWNFWLAFTFLYWPDLSDCGRARQDAENSTLLGGQVQPLGGCSDSRPKVSKVLFELWIFQVPAFFRGAKLNIGDHQKITPMLTAVLNGNIDVVTFLFK